MKTLSFPATIRDLLDHPSWDGFISDKLGNDLYLSDPERADRLNEAAEDGCDGSTHAEHIEDWREFADSLYRDVIRSIDCETDEEAEAEEAGIDAARESLDLEIDKCEGWHDSHGTLNDQIG